jgi:hypothetical protein
MKVLQSPDMIISCSLFFLCLPILPNVAALRTLVVLEVKSMWTPKLLKENKQTFDDARWILTII